MKTITIKNGELHLPRWPRLDRWLDRHEVEIVLWSVWLGCAGLGLILWAGLIVGGAQ